MVQSAIVLRLGPATFPIRLLFSLPARAIDGPLTPEQSLQYLKTEPGLRVELVAAEPLVVDPVAVHRPRSSKPRRPMASPPWPYRMSMRESLPLAAPGAGSENGAR